MKVEIENTPVYKEYKIENKPVTRPAIEREKYPLTQMKVGQSFFFLPANFEEVQRLRAAVAHFGRRNNVKFAVIKDGKGYRCGRVK